MGVALPTTPRFKNLTGLRFGKFLVMRYVGRLNRSSAWECQCDCGNVKVVTIGNLTSRRPSKSCGCFRKERLVTHGATTHSTRSDEYTAWAGMKNRCYYQEHPKFKDYGGRGITVCERWLQSFENFIADMGPRPSKLHSLDRFPNTNGNYEPNNCRWATSAEQARNRRNNRQITFDGETKCLSEWAEQYGISPEVLAHRIKKGWPMQTALTAKLHTRPKKIPTE